MHIPLNKFEQIIEEPILKRGLSYFKNGAVTCFTVISDEEYEAVVAGTENYTVHLKINDDTITEHHCDCPYDLGPVCKHLVAAIFYLKQDELNLNVPQPKKPRKKKTPSVAKQINDLLKAISHEELIDFVTENSKKDKKFRNQFLASFGHLSQNKPKAFYLKQIHSILKTAAGRDGWIGWHEMKYVVNATQPFVKNAEKYLANNNFENVFFIGTALLEEMNEALQFGDDSNGDLGYFINSAMEFLSKLTQEKLPAPLKKEFFNYCISAFNQKIFKGWDWHMGMLHLASDLAEKETDADIILNCLDSVSGEYEIEQAQALKLDVLRRFKNKKEVEQYIDQHISNSSIRKKEIEIAFKNKNFIRVVKLSKDGIKADEKDKPGLVKIWYNWLLKVAQAEKDTPKIIEYSRYLFIDNFYPEQDYYQILKNHIDKDQWHPFLEEIIQEITPKSRWRYAELIRKIYINEAWWDRLLSMLKQSPSLNEIEQNESYLKKEYAPELIGLYKEGILSYMKNNVGRNHYKTACRYLRRMKKLGGNEEVNDLVEFLRNQYPQRKALLDELSRV